MEKETRKILIEKFLKEDSEEIKLEYIPLYQYDDILKDLGFERGEIETNGWGVDFWFEYSKKEKSITLSGSLFYGMYKLTKR